MNVSFYLADQNPHRDRTKGISVYTTNLMRALSALPEIQISVCRSLSSIDPLPGQSVEHVLPLRTDRAFGRLIADQFHPLFFKAAADLWHYPKGFLPLFMKPKAAAVGTVHDVILQHYADRYPTTRSKWEYAYWLRILRRSLARFEAVLTVSHFSKTQIQEFCARYKINCPPIFVIYSGMEVDSLERGAVNKENFVMHLASDEKHKRTATLLQFWRLLQSKRTDLPELHLVGNVDQASAALLVTMSGVKHDRLLSQGQLRDKISRARALVIPSEIEGFGLPALEAYENRTPVVFAAGTSIREILGPDTRGEFSLDSADSFEAALDGVFAMDAAKVEQKAIALGRQFSWTRCASETAAVYRQVFGKTA